MDLTDHGYVRDMKLPDPRGPLGEVVNDRLTGVVDTAATPHETWPDASGPDDRALTLWTLFELAFRGFEGVDADLEWDPALIALRSSLESELEERLRADFAAWDGPREPHAMIEAFESRPGLAGFIRRDATADDVLRILRQKSVYHLKESDPHCFVLPRLEAGPKAALAELQYDELGDGDPERVHSRLFAVALDAAGLDPGYGAYVNEALTTTLESSNALSMLCLRRRLRYAAMGHLAAFESTSSLPCADVVRGLRRLGFDERVVRYYDEHVEADAVHEQLAWRDICARLADGEAEAEREIAFGVFVCLETESRNAAEILAAEDPAELAGSPT